MIKAFPLDGASWVGSCFGEGIGSSRSGVGGQEEKGTLNCKESCSLPSASASSCDALGGADTAVPRSAAGES